MKVWPQPPSLGKSRLQAILANRLERAGLGGFVAEYQFCPGRRFRFDFAWPSYMLAVECEGGGWSFGRHTRGSGFARDLVKYSEAAALGWRIVRVDSTMIDDGRAVEYVRRCLEQSRGTHG